MINKLNNNLMYELIERNFNLIDNKIMVQKKFYCPYNKFKGNLIYLKLKSYNEAEKLNIMKKVLNFDGKFDNHFFFEIYNLKEFEGYIFFFISSEFINNKVQNRMFVFIHNYKIDSSCIHKDLIETPSYIIDLSTEEVRNTLIFVLRTFFEDLKVDKNFILYFDVYSHFYKTLNDYYDYLKKLSLDGFQEWNKDVPIKFFYFGTLSLFIYFLELFDEKMKDNL